MIENANFYNALRTMGRLNEAEIPDELARQFISSGALEGSLGDVKRILAECSLLAAELSFDSFKAELKKAYAPGKGADVAASAVTFDGYTCEGTCTPAGLNYSPRPSSVSWSAR